MDKLEQIILSSMKADGTLDSEHGDYRTVFVSSVQADPTNPRFIPALLLEDIDADGFINKRISKSELMENYSGENRVLIGKGCIVNGLNKGHEQYNIVRNSLLGLVDLAENILSTDLIQPPTLYPLEDGCYRILTGHRRFYALIYAYGVNTAQKFKVYDVKPVLYKTKQFQENASRDDLSPYGKLIAFKAALHEISLYSNAKTRGGFGKLTLKEQASLLGISTGALDNFRVLTRYNCVVTAYENGLKRPFLKVKKLILELEKNYKSTKNITSLSYPDKNAIECLISDTLSSKSTPKRMFKTMPINSISLVKKLLTTDLQNVIESVIWDSINWNDGDEVLRIYKEVINYLERCD